MSTWEYTPPSVRALRWVEEAAGVGCRIVSVSRLRGGLTAAIDLVEVGCGSREAPRRLVLRRSTSTTGCISWLRPRWRSTRCPHGWRTRGTGYEAGAPLDWLPEVGLREAARQAVESASEHRQVVLTCARC